MGMEIGAATDFSDACVMIPTLYPGGVTDYWSVDHPGTTTNKYGSAQLPGSIIVNNRGNRFVQEDGMWGMIMGRIYREIIDEGLIMAEPGKTGIFAVTDSRYVDYWLTPDKHPNPAMIEEGATADDVAAAGLLIKADTLEELAAQMGVRRTSSGRLTVGMSLALKRAMLTSDVLPISALSKSAPSTAFKSISLRRWAPQAA